MARRAFLALLAAALAAGAAAVALGATGTIATVAGTGAPGFTGAGDARLAALDQPTGVSATPDGGFLIADRANHRVRRVAPDGTITTLAGTGTAGFAGDGGPAAAAQLNAPSAAVRTPDGGLLIADSGNDRVRRVSPSGVITTAAGGNPGFTNDGGPATDARVPQPTDIALAPDGGFLIASFDGDRIRRVAPNGIITTVAGNGEGAFSGDGGPATDAEIQGPYGVAATADGGILIADLENARVRRVGPDGTITTVAGTGVSGGSGDGGPATAAQLAEPARLAVAADGGFLIADRAGHRIRRVGPDGTITTLAGAGVPGAGGDGGPATAAQLNGPSGLAIDAGDDVLVADTLNHRIRLIDAGDPAGPPPGPIVLPPPGADEANLTPPRIVNAGTAGGRTTYRCTDGTWSGLAADPSFVRSWWRVPSLGRGAPVQIATGSLYRLDPAQTGIRVFCRVDASTGSGTTITARSAVTILTGRSVAGRRVVVPTRVYGDFRIRGIDVFQTVQPNSGASRAGFPSGTFPAFCGAGTPSSWRLALLGVTGCRLGTRDPARTDYAGVTLDQRMPATAVVYVNMVSTAPASPNQPLDVTLRGRVGGRLLNGALVRQVVNPRIAATPFVLAEERGGTAFGVQFAVPHVWLAVAAIQGRPLTLEASAALPVGAPFSQCDPLVATIVALRTCSAADDAFRLDGIPVVDDLAELRVRSVPLRAFGNQVLSPPDQVLARAVDLFPGGRRLEILPFDSVIDISTAAGLQLSDAPCLNFRAVPDILFIPGDQSRPADLRGCRIAGVNAAIDAWLALDRQNREGYDVLMGVHAYQTGGGAAEPGWKRGSATIADGTPTITVNDGGLGRPLTAAAHELGHALGAPHADFTDPGCGGNSAGQVGEAWPPDQNGRLQGTAFGQNGGGTRDTVPIVDSDTVAAGVRAPLFDLMSYCANGDSDAWLSPFNWSRFLAALRARRAAGAAEHATATVSGTAFVSGIVGPAGATILQVVPASGDTRVPAPDPGSRVRVRAFDAAGVLLGEVGARVEPLQVERGTGPVGTFLAPLPAATARIEVVTDGAVTDGRARSAPPTIRLIAPRTGARVRGALRVLWRSADPDPGTALQAIVEYAPDGRAFRSVSTGPDTGRAVTPAASLAAGRVARVRVTVSDGFSTATATSGPIAVAGAPPRARIVAPGPRERPSAATPVVLEGRGLDDRRRSLRGGALTWFAGQRRIGSGRTLRVNLPAGTTLVRLVARDRLGRTATATRRVRVTPVPLRVTVLRAPQRVRAGARTARLVVAASVPATLRAGGRRFAVGTRARGLDVPLAARPRTGLFRIGLRLTAPGPGGRPVRATVLVLRA